MDVGNFGVTLGRNLGEDPFLKAAVTLEVGDYAGANSDSELEADKGHQAPASFARSDSWYETNYLSNITQQDKDLNQGPWRKLEVAVRKAVAYRKPYR